MVPPPVVPPQDIEQVKTDVERAISILLAAKDAYFNVSGEAMYRYFDPVSKIRTNYEIGSVWMYTAAIEAVNATMRALIDLDDVALYDRYFTQLKNWLSTLIDNLEYYAGSYTLVSFTQTKNWTVYGVNRSSSKGAANVQGRENVYDDQQWLIKELLNAYHNTNDTRYLQKAEYLTGYVIDGWDTTLDDQGVEHGGIPWGPGYYTKHSCSNGPFISPLVMLHEIYKGTDQQIEYRYIDTDRKRKTKMMDKDEYYLMYAAKVYDFQRSHLYKKSDGVYWDMLGARGFNGDNIAYEIVDGVTYRAHNQEDGPVGESYTYNSGTMLSGAAYLYSATQEQRYLDDLKSLSLSAFRYFAKPSTKYQGLYEYPITGFSPWFNCVLLHGWIDASKHYSNVGVQVKSFQDNLDFAYDNYNQNGLLPTSLHYGWNRSGSNRTEALTTFAYATEYAAIASYYTHQ